MLMANKFPKEQKQESAGQMNVISKVGIILGINIEFSFLSRINHTSIFIKCVLSIYQGIRWYEDSFWMLKVLSPWWIPWHLELRKLSSDTLTIK